MSSGRFDPKRAREAGQKGGRAKARRKLTLDRVEAEFGDLDTLEDAQRWLRLVGTWAAAGLLAGTVANAAVRSIDVWLRAHESKLTRELVDKLKARIEAAQPLLVGYARKVGSPLRSSKLPVMTIR